MQFFDLAVGCPLVVSEIEIATEMNDTPEPAQVYAVAYIDQYRGPDDCKLGINTILINPVHEAEVFSNVLKKWLAKDELWGTARARLRRVWARRSYTVDRLVAAANVFDLLPDDTFGSKPPLPPDLRNAKEQARAIFLDLPESQERNNVLGSLGRIGNWTLKRKIRHRAESIVTTIGGLVPGIDDVIREAVALRNDYVHGPSRSGHERRNEQLVFLTDSLEFLFLASDLVDAGWDIAKWCREPRSVGHPFWDYLSSYHANVAILSSGS